MKTLLQLKSRIKEFYEKNYAVVRPFMKFVIAFCVFELINQNLGFISPVLATVIALVLAFISGITPNEVTVYFGAALAVAQVCLASIVLGISLLFVVLVLYLMMGRYAKEMCYVIVAVPLFNIIHMSYLVPVVAALFFSPVVLPALLIGVMLRYLIGSMETVLATPVSSTQLSDTLSVYRSVVDSIAKNKIMFLFIVAFVLAYLVTYFIRRQSKNHASQIGILAGYFIMVVTLLVGNILLNTELKTAQTLLYILLCAGVSYVIQFFRLTLDYTGTKSIQFEDDEYYYYVKAVPKLKIAQKEKTLKTINPKIENEDGNNLSNLQEEFDKVLDEENGKR